jgi:tetratricopeptide (TPR) repeat protein
MGSTFSAMHHHCWGLVAVRRAATQRLTKQDRDHLISNSVNEFTYVINSAGKSFVLLPEVFTRRAQSQLLIGREREAIEDFKQAWSLKPDYWPAYAYLADYFIARKNYKSAREVLDLGLKEAPGSKALAERRSKLPREQEAAAEKNPTASPR